MTHSRARRLTSAYMRLYNVAGVSKWINKDLPMPVDMLMSPEVCNCQAVRSAARHVTQLYDQLMAPTGLRATQFTILAKLQALGPLPINTLAKDMVMDRTTLGRNILPLERDGLIRIAATEKDRRVKELHLTKAGEKRLQAAVKKWSEAQDRFEGMFGQQRAEELRAILRALVATSFASSPAGTQQQHRPAK